MTRPLKKRAQIVGQASSLPGCIENDRQLGRQDACPTTIH